MVFSSLAFICVFLPLVLALYHLAPHVLRNHLLLVASLGFYAIGEGWYTAVMLGAIVAGWGFGLLVGRCPPGPARAALLAISMISLIGVLLVFKYANFLRDNLCVLAAACGLDLPGLAPVHLPIGVSFFVFQALSYVIDVHRGEVPPETSILRFGVYKSFFPQLIAGPIVRWKDVRGQLGRRDVALADVSEGLRRFTIGLAKKVLVANAVAPAADAVFGLAPGQLSMGAAWFGAGCYAVQILFDFSGYSDMAIGLARMFGFRFLENFDRPYTATSARDFWRRWHISLSTWFRDYLYIPLGGSRGGAWRTAGNLAVVFLLCGLWHGAGWPFLVWGAWHGCFLAAEHLLQARWRPGGLGGAVYAALVVFVGWVFFRAESLGQAGGILAAMAGADAGAAAPWWRIADGQAVAMLVVGLVLAMGRPPAWLRAAWQRLPWDVLRPAIIAVVLALCLAALAASASNPFIYFRF